jgi:hypothetical protein
MATATCPGCGAPVHFRIGATASVVCARCRSLVVRSDRGLQNLGRVADVVSSDTGLAVGDRGAFRGRSFEVIGRLVLQHPAGGTWEEYYVVLGADHGWIAQAQGRWTVVMKVQAQAPPMDAVRVGATVALGAAHGTFVVGETTRGVFLSADGELPFAARLGTPRAFADLSGQGGTVATIDYGQGGEPPTVYVGWSATLAELAVQRRGDQRGQTVGARDVKCPSCGAPSPRVAGASTRMACRYCGALSDLETHRVLAQQDAARAAPWIPLGARGTLWGVEWIVIGYVERRADAGGETFGWQEYLFYNEQQGFRWLVIDEGVCLFGQPIPAAEVDTSGAPHVVRVRGVAYRRRNAGNAKVTRVLGEFYWKVEIGEEVWAEDYEDRGNIVSRERAQGEENWTVATPVEAALISQAFGLQGRSEGPTSPVDVNWKSHASIIMLVVVLFFGFFLVSALDSCSDDSSAGGIRGGSVGGFGGK